MRDFDEKYRQLRRLDDQLHRIREKHDEIALVRSAAVDQVRGGGRYDLADVVAKQEALVEQYKAVYTELTDLQLEFLREIQKIESPLYQDFAMLRFIRLDRRPLAKIAKELGVTPQYCKKVSSKCFNWLRADDNLKPPLPSTSYRIQKGNRFIM